MVRDRPLSWRVQRDLSLTPQPPSASSEEPVIDAMVRELALRIYTDLALGSTVRWEASEQFVEGLRLFRSCLRTPKGRKVNLRHAEDSFLEALAQDEKYPSANYNLGVLYTELLGLATAAGRDRGADAHKRRRGVLRTRDRAGAGALGLSFRLRPDSAESWPP